MSSCARGALALLPFALVAGSLDAQTRIVNAPVAPEAIYVGTGGASPGISVIDLNGFGQGTGDLANTRFPLNPNIGKPGVFPPLAPGSSTLDAGSAGALTLARDQLGSARLIGAPQLASVTDLELGQPLDLVFNNAAINPLASSALQLNPATGIVQPGNTIMVAPHPNPPRLVFPPPHPAAGIEAEEPTVTSSVGPSGRVLTQSPPCLPSPRNELGIGNPFASSPGEVGIFGARFPDVFYGPQPPPPAPPPPLAFCPFTSRQQIGHFLYALDRAAQRVLVLNSNRFTVLGTLDVADPADIAIAPNLRWLAVSEAQGDTVTVFDADPLSARFHQVIARVPVGAAGPTSLAWQPDGEALLVCSPGAGTLSILDAGSFRVRRVLHVGAPTDVAVTARQIGFGDETLTWFAYVLDGDRIHVYESGPEGVGPDAIVATLGPFPAATVVRPDVRTLGSAVWVAHRDTAGLGQISRLELSSTPPGPRFTHDVPPSRTWTVTTRLGGVGATTPVRDFFSGNVLTDFAFDEIVNEGGFPDVPSPVRPDLPRARHSGKGHVKETVSGPVAAISPLLLLVAAADAGKVDVVDFRTGRRLTSIDVPDVRVVASYWRQ